MDNLPLINDIEKYKATHNEFQDKISGLETKLSDAKTFIIWIRDTAKTGMAYGEMRRSLEIILEQTNKALIEERPLKEGIT